MGKERCFKEAEVISQPLRLVDQVNRTFPDEYQ